MTPTHADTARAMAAFDEECARWRINRTGDYFVAIDDNAPLEFDPEVTTVEAVTSSYTVRRFSSHADAADFVRLRAMARALSKMEASQTTREKIIEFSTAFGRPVNDRVLGLSVTDRLLLGNLVFEEAVEYITDGLGLDIMHDDAIAADLNGSRLTLVHNEGRFYKPVDAADGLADLNVVIHFNSNWHGWNLDAVTAEVHDSNMSKLDDDGNPIINGESDGYKEGEDGFDPNKPLGKILKSANFREPNIASVIYHNYSE